MIKVCIKSWQNIIIKEIDEESQLTCINETLFPTIAVSPITTPVP